MDNKICPLQQYIADISDTDTYQTCIRERCAWWCSEVSTPTTTGSCAIRMIALAAAKNTLK